MHTFLYQNLAGLCLCDINVVLSGVYREVTMETKPDLQARLDKLRREYRGVRSMIEMMQKGTDVAVLRKMCQEKLDPIEREIREVVARLKEDPLK